jgi:uncharacterized membrane protein (UPF0127 family)
VRAGFLEPLVRRGGADVSLVNVTRGTTVAARIEAAFDSGSRNRGLLGRDRMPEGRALVLAPCSSVHTFFMRFALDLLFVARNGRVKKAKRAVAPWRIALAPGSFAVVEVAPGTVDRSGTRPGDFLEVRRPEAV